MTEGGHHLRKAPNPHLNIEMLHDDVIKWKHFPRYWPFVWGIHRSPVNSPHKGQWHRALMFSLICVWINGWVNNREAGDLRRHRAHYDVTAMAWSWSPPYGRQCSIYPTQSILWLLMTWWLTELSWHIPALALEELTSRRWFQNTFRCETWCNAL